MENGQNATDDLLAGIDSDVDAAASPEEDEKARKKAETAAKRKATRARNKAAKEARESALGAADPTQATPQETAEGGFKPNLKSDSKLPNQGPKEEWPVIEIDEVEGMPNFEFIAVNDVPFQIQRGVETAVPPAVLKVLQNAVAGRLVQSKDSQGGVMSKIHRYAGIPYRVVRWGSK